MVSISTLSFSFAGYKTSDESGSSISSLIIPIPKAALSLFISFKNSSSVSIFAATK